MPEKPIDNPADSGADMDDGVNDSDGERGTGGRGTGAVVYLDRREFLIASASDGRPKWLCSTADGRECWVICPTYHRAKMAASGKLLRIDKLTRNDMQRLMAEELKGYNQNASSDDVTD